MIPIAKAFLYSVLGIALATLGLESFIVPSGLIDGGITGVSLLLSQITGQPLWLFLLLINAPFVIAGVIIISPRFAVTSAVTIAGLALAVQFTHLPVVTTDRLLAAIFGGCSLGAGIGLAMRGASVLDGTEIIAMLASRRTGLPVGDIILLVNIVIFSVAAFFLSIESVLYSIITYLAASKSVDFILYGLEEQVGLMIVSNEAEDLRQKLIHDLNLGVTLLHATSGLLNKEQRVLMCIANRIELSKIKEVVLETDHNAFVMTHKLSFTMGGKVKYRQITH